MTPRTQTRPSTQPSPFAKQTGVLLVKRLTVRQDDTFPNNKRYELETNQAAPNDVIHLSQRMDKAAYAEALALCPAIADMTWNDLTKRSLTLVTYWDVSYHVEMRAFGRGTHGVKAAKKIVATAKPTADAPAINPDTVAAVATMEAYEAAQRATAETTTDELTAYLRGDHDNELGIKETIVSNPNDAPAQPKTVHSWAADNKELGAFWKAVNGKNNQFIQWREMKDKIEFVHEAIGGKLHDTSLTREQCQDTVIHEANERWGAIENKRVEAPPIAETQSTGRVVPVEAETPAQSSVASSESANVTPITTGDNFEIDPFLLEAKTLMGIPATRIQEFINRPYEPWAKSSTKESFGTATVIDPLAVRQRFDKVFGPHGIGWHIVPVENGASMTLTPFVQHTSKGERDMYQITLSGYVMEYRIRIGENIEWQRTSAFTDSNDSDDLGYAGGGAFSSLMKQALKMLGGYDHFIIPEKKRKAAHAA